MSSSKVRCRCPAFIFAPVLESGKVFGINFVMPCSCWPVTRRRKIGYIGSIAFRIYTDVVELFLWSVVLLAAVRVYNLDFYCLRMIHMFNEYAFHASVATLFTIIYMAWQYSILKRKRCSLHFVECSYQNEWEIFEGMQIYLLGCVSVTLCVFIVISLTCGIFIYSEIKRQKGTDTEAFLCSLFHAFTFSHIAGQLLFLLICGFLIFLLLSKRFLRLSDEMKNIRMEKYFLKETLDNFIRKQVELWEGLELLNKKWKMLIPLIYIHFMYETCFCLYAVLFINTELKFRIVLVLLFLMIFNGLILVCWKLSTFTSLIYNNFVSIGRFSSANLPVLFKFKLTCFMKRYYKRNPLGISMAGFFYIKRNFLIRVLSGLYSIFSPLLQLSGAHHNKRRCEITYRRSIFNNSET